MRKETHVCPQLGKSTTSPQRQPEGQVAIRTLVLSLQWYKEVTSRLMLHLLDADNKDSADALKKKRKKTASKKGKACRIFNIKEREYDLQVRAIICSGT